MEETVACKEIAMIRLVVSIALLSFVATSPVKADDGNLSATRPSAARLTVTPVGRLGTTRYRHGECIDRLWYTSDDRLVSASNLCLRLWNVENGERIQSFEAAAHSRLAFDGEGRVLVAEPLVNGVPSQTFRLINLGTGSEIVRWTRPEWNESVALSRSGAFAVMGLYGVEHVAVVVDARTGREIERIERYMPRTSMAGYPQVALSPDDRVLAVKPRKDHVRFYELGENGAVTRVLMTIEGKPCDRIIFSPRPEEVVLLSRQHGSLWNMRTAEQLRSWENPGLYVASGAVFERTGQTLLELTGDTVLVRDMLSGEELRSFELNFSLRGNAIALSPDESVVAVGGLEGRVCFFDFASGEEIRFDGDRESHAPPVSVAVSDDGAWIASATFRGEVSVWGRRDAWKRSVMPDDDIQSRVTFDTNADSNFVTFLPGEATLLSGSGVYHNSVNLWDVASERREHRYEGYAWPIYGVAVSQDGRVMAAIGRGSALRVWSRDGATLQKIDVPARTLSLSPDGSLVAVCASQDMAPRRDQGGASPPRDAPTVELWCTKTGRLVRSHGKATDSPWGFYSVSFSHGGRHLAATSDEGLYVWGVDSGKRVRLIPVPNAAKKGGCAFSPTERIVAVPASDGSIDFFDVAAEGDAPIATVQGHDGPVNSGAWLRNGRGLVSGGNDATIALWRVDYSHE